MLVRMPVEKRKWLEQRAAETGDTMTDLLMDALDLAIKQHQRNVERRA